MRKYTAEQQEQNKTAMIDAALKMAEKIGFASLTRVKVAEACRVSPGLVSQRFGTLDAMRRDILRAAMKKESLSVLAYAVATKHPICKKFDPALRKKIAAHLTGK